MIQRNLQLFSCMFRLSYPHDKSIEWTWYGGIYLHLLTFTQFWIKLYFYLHLIQPKTNFCFISILIYISSSLKINRYFILDLSAFTFSFRSKFTCPLVTVLRTPIFLWDMGGVLIFRLWLSILAPKPNGLSHNALKFQWYAHYKWTFQQRLEI